MPRSDVYQLRLYPGEKERLKALAVKGGHQSIATMIRATFGLDASALRVTRDGVDVTDEHEELAATVQVIEDNPDLISRIASSTAHDEAQLTRRINQLCNQGYTRPVAARMAKAEMEE